MRTVLVALGCSLVTACSQPAPHQKASNPAPTPAAAPKPKPVITGAVVDAYTGRPYAGVTLTLSIYSGGCYVPKATATAAADGRVQFDPLPATCRGDDTVVFQAESCKDCMPQTPLTAAGKKLEGRASQTDIGTIVVADDRWATATFAGTCRGGPLPTELTLSPAAPALTVLDWRGEKDGWQASSYTREQLVPEPLLPWPAVLCLRSSYREVGRYGAGSLGPVGHAKTTRATAVRLKDGRRFGTTVSAEPPSTSNSRTDEYGNTDGAVRDWLRKTAAANP